MSQSTDRGRTPTSGNNRGAKSSKVKRKRKKERKITRGEIYVLISMAIGFVLSIFSIFLLSNTIVITAFEIILLFLGFGVFSGILYYFIHKADESKDKLNIPFFIVYSIVGPGGILVFLFMVLNSTLSSGEVYIERYQIVGVDPAYEVYRWGKGVYLLENDQFENDPYLRALDFKFHGQINENSFMEYEFYRGAFGFAIKKDHRLEKTNKPSE